MLSPAEAGIDALPGRDGSLAEPGVGCSWTRTWRTRVWRLATISGPNDELSPEAVEAAAFRAEGRVRWCRRCEPRPARWGAEVDQGASAAMATPPIGRRSASTQNGLSVGVRSTRTQFGREMTAVGGHGLEETGEKACKSLVGARGFEPRTSRS